jgi:diguanylate cyclase
MPDSEKRQQKKPAEIAREAFRRLAALQVAPTPDAYRDLYNEVAGVSPSPGADAVLVDFAAGLLHCRSDLTDFSKNLSRAVAARDWDTASKGLGLLAEKYLKKTALADPASAHPGDDQANRMLREMLSRVLTFSVAALAKSTPDLAAEAEALSLAVREIQSEDALGEIGTRIKQFCYRLELKSADLTEQQELQLRLLRLLLENVSELVEDGSWVQGQISVVEKLISGPINSHTLEDATRSLKEAIYKQGALKHSLTEAKVTLKNMMAIFIDQLGTVASSADDYHQKLDGYTDQINQAQDISQLSHLLNDIMRETRIVQTQTLRSRDDMIAARSEVEKAESRIHSLESQLEQMSALVREDQLTGSLNRRGLEDVFQREAARADRRGTPLCVAMLDLDNFKKLNDTYGHSAGDDALIHLVKVVKETLRTTDVVARFGGEEFLILLPDTGIEEASEVIIRLQRELTKRIFMRNNERLFITFSAGVALRAHAEDQSSVTKRADDALYRAKKAGKNCVIAAV